MDRREAIAALMSLPATARITRARLNPTDVIVIECKEYLAPESARIIQTHIERIWPGQKCVVLPRELTLKIVEGKPE